MEITTKDFINPENNQTENLTIIAWGDGSEHKYICTHEGGETIVHINNHGLWVGEDEAQTPLTTALGNVIEHHSS